MDCEIDLIAMSYEEVSGLAMKNGKIIWDFDDLYREFESRRSYLWVVDLR
jgi:hypothetical protein